MYGPDALNTHIAVRKGGGVRRTRGFSELRGLHTPFRKVDNSQLEGEGGKNWTAGFIALGGREAPATPGPKAPVRPFKLLRPRLLPRIPDRAPPILPG